MTLKPLERYAVVEHFMNCQTDEEWERLRRTLASDGEPVTLTIVVDGGCVSDVLGLPDGWQYEIKDHDILDEHEEEKIEDESAVWFRNHYKCYRCGYEWTDEWDAQPDDDCTECGARHVSPYKSEEMTREGD